MDISVDMEQQIYSEPLIDGKREKKIPYFIKNLTPYLAPKEKISDDLGFMSNIYRLFEKPVFIGVIKYKDINNSEYAEKFTLDFEAMKYALPYIEKEENA